MKVLVSMLELKNIHIDYDNQPLLRGVDFKVGEDETVCLLGASGSGKSTILRIIAGLVKPRVGQVLWDGEDLALLPPHRRRFGFMFQDYALFPHLNVYDNVAFGLRMQNMEDKQLARRVEEVLALARIAPLKERFTADLSGGEKQRVAFARAIAPHPQLLMLDEPLASLDRTLRARLLEELHQLLRETAIPVIYVTHDQEEAFTIADRLLLLNAGRIVQSDNPQEVYTRPLNLWAASFLGFTNQLTGILETSSTIKTDLGEFTINSFNTDLKIGERVTLVIPPQAIQIIKAKKGGNVVKAIVRQSIFQGSDHHVLAEVQGDNLSFFTMDHVKPASQIYLSIDPSMLLCYPGK